MRSDYSHLLNTKRDNLIWLPTTCDGEKSDKVWWDGDKSLFLHMKM